MRMNAVTWASDVALLAEACQNLSIDLQIWSTTDLLDIKKYEECLNSLEDSDLILLHPSHEFEWDDILEHVGKNVPVVVFGRDPSLWSLSNVSPSIISQTSEYHIRGGLNNVENMIRYLGREVLNLNYDYQPPKDTLWQGIYHPDVDAAFESVEEYLAWRSPRHQHTIGLLFFRTYWANGDLKVVNSFIRELEKKFNVIPVFCMGMGDRDLGAKNSGEVTEEFFTGRINALINLQSIFHAGNVEQSRQVLDRLDVPVFHPLMSYHSQEEGWRADTLGLSSGEVGWSVAMPEFEGAIEPILVGVASSDQIDGVEIERHVPLETRVEKVVSRVENWVNLQDIPLNQKKVAFILHNSPCASLEASIGSAAHLDSLESVAFILKRMKEAGYHIENSPSNGEEIIKNILDHKAIAEFRWTTIEEIVKKGGALHLMSKEDYVSWFGTLPDELKERVCNTWGSPPGESKDGVPTAMVYQDKLVITGVQYGNAVICIQPKRGCAGSKCDGQVCKILHDPEVPPPHQYLATYRYLEQDFGADVIVHVGTHGNLEFLPGKSVALSEACVPDAVIGTVPHLYIYNSDNPPEGTIAKRRSYAVLVDHMQTVMTGSGLYGELKELEDRISEYNRNKASDKFRAHALEHIILDLIRKANLDLEIDLERRLEDGTSFEEIINLAHEKITEVYNTQIPDGMHIFGQIPTDQRKVGMIRSILRYESVMKKLLTTLMGQELKDEAEVEDLSMELISAFMEGEGMESVERLLGDRLNDGCQDAVSSVRDQVMVLSSLIEASDEMGSLFHGFNGGYIPAGPSGLLTRGKPEILPTGRNFYSLDPNNVPTQAAWRTGRKLSDSLIKKHLEDHDGAYPENVATYWMASDVMWSDGEQLAQMMYLIGVEPIWKGGRVRGYRVIPYEELGRPRIDLTIRVSGITRDCFFNCVEFLDLAIKEVSSLDEKPEHNYLKKHVLENGDGARIFASKPGTYGNGVNLAVYASAWETEKDLSDVFVYWNGYAYGKGTFGEEAHKQLLSQLQSVDLTFNKTVTDEYDLFGCCCYFGTHGGLTTAAKEHSHKHVSTYYGDTRDPNKVAIRTLADEVRRVVRTKLLNPKWIDGMKRHGYQGAGNISKRVGRVYGWEATTQEVDDWVFDEVTKTFILDEEMKRFFQETNPWALEEMGRRLLEAYQRGLWNADQEVIEDLKETYLEIEGWMEDKMGETEGDFQGGAIDAVTVEEVKAWKEKMAKALNI